MTNENNENVEIYSDSSVDSAESTPKTLLLSEFMRESGLTPNEKSGKFIPKTRQIKDLVNCIDDCLDKTGKLINLARIDTSDITSMNRLFENSTRTKDEFNGIESWNTSNVTSFAYAFSRAEHFDSDISGWNVEKGKGFYYMFFHAHNFNQPIGAEWHTKSAKNMRAMFCFATKFNNGGKDFGKNWVMDNVDLSAEMFYNTENFNADGLNDWNMSNIKKCWSMFRNARAFNQPLDEWNLPNCHSFWGMFYGAESFNQDLSAWGTRLDKVKSMENMFADTKSLDINFLQDWQISADCNTEHIIKGSKLEQILKNQKTQSTENIAQDKTRKLKDIAKFTISQVKDSDLIQKICANLSENKGFVVNKSSWIPSNILNSYKVCLAKDDEKDASKITKANIDDFQYAFCRIFDDINFVITIDDASAPFDKENIGESFDIYQYESIDKYNETGENNESNFNEDNKYNIEKGLEFYLANSSMLIINKPQENSIGDNSNIISDIINAYILAKAYKTKMQHLNALANKYKEISTLEKIRNFICRKGDTLHKAHKEICTFDLKYYQENPVNKNKVVLDRIWNNISKYYLIAQTHNELKETIKQVAELVSDENQKRFNRIMFAVAIFSAFSALPVIKDIILWIASKL